MSVLLEGKMKEIATMLDDGMSCKEIAKELKVPVSVVEKAKKSLGEESLDEAVSRQERIKRGQRMKRKKRFLSMKKDIAARRMPDQDKLMKRARKAAIKKVKQRLSKKDSGDMSVGEKNRVEDRVKKMSSVVDRMARKLLPTMKKTAREKLAKRSGKKNESVDLTFGQMMDVMLEEWKDVELRKLDEAYRGPKRSPEYYAKRREILNRTSKPAKKQADVSRMSKSQFKRHEMNKELGKNG